MRTNLKSNSVPRKSYYYSAILDDIIADDIVKKNWTGGTTALSEKQALSNLTYKCKVALGVVIDTRVHLDPKYLKSV